MFKSKTENKDVSTLLQEQMKHLLVPESALDDINNIAKLSGVKQQRITVEIFKHSIHAVAKKHKLIPKSVQEN